MKSFWSGVYQQPYHYRDQKHDHVYDGDHIHDHNHACDHDNNHENYHNYDHVHDQDQDHDHSCDQRQWPWLSLALWDVNCPNFLDKTLGQQAFWASDNMTYT